MLKIVICHRIWLFRAAIWSTRARLLIPSASISHLPTSTWQIFGLVSFLTNTTLELNKLSAPKSVANANDLQPSMDPWQMGDDRRNMPKLTIPTDIHVLSLPATVELHHAALKHKSRGSLSSHAHPCARKQKRWWKAKPNQQRSWIWERHQQYLSNSRTALEFSVFPLPEFNFGTHFPLNMGVVETTRIFHFLKLKNRFVNSKQTKPLYYRQLPRGDFGIQKFI